MPVAAPERAVRLDAPALAPEVVDVELHELTHGRRIRRAQGPDGHAHDVANVQAEAMISVRSWCLGVQPRARRMRVEEATRTAGSPGRRAPTATAIARP